MSSNNYRCPNCHSSLLALKKEASYIYTYDLVSDSTLIKATTTPFEFRNRTRLNTKEYLYCENCGKTFDFNPHDFI